MLQTAKVLLNSGRQKIKSLLLYNEKQAVRAEVEALALQHHLLSPFTAFIAVDNYTW